MSEADYTVLAIDDDPTQLELLGVYFSQIDFPHIEYVQAETAEKGFELLHSRTVDAVLTDYRLPDASGLEVLTRCKEYNPLIRVVVMTAFENARDAVHILKSGGDDYLVKPTKKREIEHLIVRLFEQSSIERENAVVNNAIQNQFEELPMVYESDEMRNVLNLVSRSAQSDATVLLTGESGTGKELLARLMHESSPRKDQPFITVNIAALPESLMESELFGHIKGSFTGADQDRKGRFEEADGGTLFIDEVGDIPPAIQVKLLRVIQFGQVQRIGENKTRNLDVRIIAATNRDLEQMAAENEFRSDLYWRLNVIHIAIPPLRKRKKDIIALTEHFIEEFNRKNRRSIQGISREAMDLLMQHDFPGNVRELENLIERSIILARGNLISLRDLPLHPAGNSSGGPLSSDATENCNDPEIQNYEKQMNDFESRLLKKALAETGGNQSEAARRLNITERRLRSRLQILGIHSEKSD